MAHGAAAQAGAPVGDTFSGFSTDPGGPFGPAGPGAYGLTTDDKGNVETPAPGLSPTPDPGPDAKGVLGNVTPSMEIASKSISLDPYVGTTHDEPYGPALDPSVPVSPQEPFAPVAPPPPSPNPIDIGPLPGLSAPVSNQASLGNTLSGLGLIGTAQAASMTADEIAAQAQDAPSTSPTGLAASHAIANTMAATQSPSLATALADKAAALAPAAPTPGMTPTTGVLGVSPTGGLAPGFDAYSTTPGGLGGPQGLTAAGPDAFADADAQCSTG